MAAKYKAGDEVTLAAPASYTVAQVKFNEDTGEPRYLVEWVSADGETHQRWFEENELA